MNKLEGKHFVLMVMWLVVGVIVFQHPDKMGGIVPFAFIATIFYL